jgi:acetyltransferase-like isoleucine patch superfamily enzyme
MNIFYDIKCQVYSSIVRRSLRKCGSDFKVGYPSTFYGTGSIEIGENFNSFARLRLEAFKEHNGVRFEPNLIIGNNVSMNYDCHIGCINKIVIEDNVLIASKVFITDHSHGDISNEAFLIPPSKRILSSKGPVIIRKNVWIGEGVVIMPNVEIGENTVIGANSVVTKDIPSNSVVGGIPAKIIKTISLT